MPLTTKEQELLSTYQIWIKANELLDKCNCYFISKTAMLVFQMWDLEKLINESIWLKIDDEKWKYYMKNSDQKFEKSFSLVEIIEIEKEFILKKLNLK